MAEKTAEIELQQLKTALAYLAGLLEEGSLTEVYEEETRQEMAHVIDLLVEKVAGLPANTAQNLVQATAVRAIVGASDRMRQLEHEAKTERRAHHMREAEVRASVLGHELAEWQQVQEGDMEYSATCQHCGGVIYVSYDHTYDLLPEECGRL